MDAGDIFKVTEKHKKNVLKILEKMNEHMQGRNGKPYEWSLNDFDIGYPLGRGKLGRVYLARDRNSGLLFALKLLHKSEIMKRGLQLQVLREIEIQSHLRHPHILNLYTYFHDERFIYLVLEYAAGGELFDAMHSMPEKRFPEKRVAKYIFQVVSALIYCHEKNVIHRDIKPENILLSLHGDIKLSDFGWSVHAPNSYRETMCGTLDYLPPEIVTRKRYNKLVDNWCIGVLCYELLVGNPPFESRSNEATYEKIKKLDYTFPPIVSEMAADLIRKLLCQNPKDRIELEDILRHPWIISNYIEA